MIHASAGFHRGVLVVNRHLRKEQKTSIPLGDRTPRLVVQSTRCEQNLAHRGSTYTPFQIGIATCRSSALSEAHERGLGGNRANCIQGDCPHGASGCRKTGIGSVLIVEAATVAAAERVVAVTGQRVVGEAQGARRVAGTGWRISGELRSAVGRIAQPDPSARSDSEATDRRSQRRAGAAK